MELSTEDCDEWARMQREKEIEDGVEAPPGYLPKFQLNRIQNAANQLAAQQQQQQQSTISVSQNSNLNCGSSTMPTGVGQSDANDGQRQQQQQLQASTITPAVQSPSPAAPWPHVLCSAQSPELMGSMEQRLAALGPKVHSQVDFIHCLVPDLQKITSCGFYWGKMDRYQAETLLDGKPEGTFLLRDSAQEEFLFSVSFRKYGRSLHARIEQFNHKFSFDSHDPGVYTATTVTGLLEHYKDPSCVMFFEPMLTQPLNRNFCFSLQQLCRATIVSNTTYDNIGDLKLPHVMKAYLKEYHYKQKVRVKMFDELSNRAQYGDHRVLCRLAEE